MSASPPDRHRVLAELRESIRRIERRPARRSGVAASRLREIDEALPDGGFPRGALSELRGGAASGKTAVALAVLAALGDEELFAWVDGRGELYPPAAAARGVDLGRLLIVRPPFDSVSPARTALPVDGARGRGAQAERPIQAALWAAEALLGSSAFAAVVVDVPLGRARATAGWDAAARRLQAAAEKGGAVGLWLSAPPLRQAQGERSAVRVPAALRLELWAEGGRTRARACAMAGGGPHELRRGHVA